ncbi:MAG: GH3 auxin-responsive promoter family protein, partial [Planctomycetota bacterium]|nr:GH3 auxin-responsive promoter family protein [Planctomycetota bacterium]
GAWFRFQVGRQVRAYRKDQNALALEYGVTPSTPIHSWGPYMQKRIDEFASQTPGTRFAYTSGSTAQPKKVAFPLYRLQSLRKGSLSVASRMMLANRVERMGMFILASLKEDDSLTSLILGDQGAGSPYLVGLLMPGKYLRDKCIRELTNKYGATAVRFWMITLADPGIVYSTNPSTLAQFLISLTEEWKTNSQLIREFTQKPDQFSPDVIRVAKRIVGNGWEERLRLISEATECPPMDSLFPGLRKYCCWDGGYARPFLEQIRAFLKPDRVQLIPMYSMSTESVETLNVFDGENIHFVPIAPRVLYEFLPEGKEDLPENLLSSWDLEPGHTYAMVLSDPYGLQRYQTEDLFLCKGTWKGLPDLHFMRRRGLAFSFTGEKLTGEQIMEAYGTLRAEFPALADIHLTCIPSRPEKEKVPLYRLVVAHPGNQLSGELDPEGIGDRFDQCLGEINEEFAAKRESDRLGKTRVEIRPYDVLATHLDAKTSDKVDIQQRAWDSQFKLLPLYKKLWEDLGL